MNYSSQNFKQERCEEIKEQIARLEEAIQMHRLHSSHDFMQRQYEYMKQEFETELNLLLDGGYLVNSIDGLKTNLYNFEFQLNSENNKTKEYAIQELSTDISFILYVSEKQEKQKFAPSTLILPKKELEYSSNKPHFKHQELDAQLDTLLGEPIYNSEIDAAYQNYCLSVSDNSQRKLDLGKNKRKRKFWKLEI